MIFQSSDIQKAASLIQKGELVAFPTETVYGLGASVFLPTAIQKIFTVKGRPQDNPLIVHISNLEQLSSIVKEIPDIFYHLAEAFFPGPLTVLLSKQDGVPSIVSAGLETIGVRMPAHPLAKELIERVGAPLVAPSANLSGKPSSTTAQHVLEDFGEKIAGVVDGGSCQYGIESTVIMLTPTPTILRPGAISQEQLESILQCSIPFAEEESERPLSPGMKYRHYAPRAKVTLFYSQEHFTEYLNSVQTESRLILTSLTSSTLYTLLRQADAECKEEIVILCTLSMQRDRALMNRLSRSAR